jgi:hypothetical protein
MNLYTNGHASGEQPNGILVTNSFSTFIEGLSTNSGDQGLLEDGFSFIAEQTASFAKVYDGVSNGFNLYTSGVIPVAPPSAVLDMFVFGITGTESGFFDYYVKGKAAVYNDIDLFVFGIIGLPSDSVSLYLEVTATGVLNSSNNVYIHGY